MRKIHLAVYATTLGLLSFVVLCLLDTSIHFLRIYFFGLIGALVWMVMVILKHGNPSTHTFDERFYDNRNLGPRRDTPTTKHNGR